MDLPADMVPWGLKLALPGAVCGLVVGTTSTGGGPLLTPGLLLLGIPAPVAIGSDLLIASVMKLFGGGAYALRGQVHWPTVHWLACGSVPGALIGVHGMNLLLDHRMDALLRPWVTVLLDVVIGGVVATTSVLSAAATVAQVASGRVDFVLAAWVLLGGVPGVMCGARWVGALPERPLRGGLACI
jgi:uncharacterized membrane protein YfcA